MNPDKDSIFELIKVTLTELREDLNLVELKSINSKTPIFGSGLDLDSMGVVHLISDLEVRLYEKYGLNWILADERALSRTRSPFRTVGDLSEFVLETQPEA